MTSEISNLTFRPAKNSDDYQEILDYSIDAFSESPDFDWDLDSLKAEVKDGWKIKAVLAGKEIIAAILYKLEKEGKHKSLLTKNTAIKFNHQGSGHSHSIKEHLEEVAKELGANKVKHYCRIDNFRAYSLNESHGYKKTPNTLENGLIVEWEKSLK